MHTLLSWLQKHLVWSIPGAMALGLAFGWAVDAAFLGCAILPLTLLMVYPMMVGLNLKALLGAVVDVPMGPVALQIALIVFLPMALGQLTQKALIAKHGAERFNSHVKLLFPPWSTLGVLGIVFVSMALRAPDIVRAPQVLPAMLLPLVLLYALNFVISTLVGRALFPRGEAIALVFGAVIRNLSIALAIAIGIFREQGADAALLISMAYIAQVQSAAWYVRFTDRLFGQPAAPAARAA